MTGKFWWWSPSRCTFYPPDMQHVYKASVHGWPADAVKVPDSVFREFGLGGERRGMKRGCGPDGMPAWVPVC